MIAFQTFLVFDDLDSIEEWRSGIWKNVPHKDLVWCASHDCTGGVGFGENHHRDEAPFSLHTVTVTYRCWWGPWCRVAVVCIFQVFPLQNDCFSPFPYFLEWSYYKQPLAKKWGGIWNSAWEIVALPTYLFIQSFIHINVNSWILFHIWDHKSLLYFFVQIVPALAMETFMWLLCPVDILWSFLIFFFYFEHFVISGATRISSFILYISCLSLRISHFSRKPWFSSSESGIINQAVGTQ